MALDFKTTNPLGIIGIIGAIILVIGVFCNWIEYDVNLIISHTTYDFSGWDLYSDDFGDGKFSDLGMGYLYAPLLCLIVGVLSIILMIFPIVMNAEKYRTVNDVLGLVTLVLSIVAVIVTVLYYMQDLSDDLALTDVFDISYGYWMCLAGAIITMVGGLMPVIKNKLMH